MKKLFRVLLGLLFWVPGTLAQAQLPFPKPLQQSPAAPADTAGYVAIAADSDTSFTAQILRLEAVSLFFNNSITFLRKGFDSTDMVAGLVQQEQLLQLLHRNIYDEGKLYNLRNLYASRIILLQLQRNLSGNQEKLVAYNQRLTELYNQIRGHKSDSLLQKMPADTVLQQQFLRQVVDLTPKMYKADSLVSTTIRQVAHLQNRMATTYFDVIDLLDETDSRIREYRRSMFHSEDKPIWAIKAGDYASNLLHATLFSLRRSVLLFVYYWRLNIVSLFVCLLLAAAFAFWWGYNYRRISNSSSMQHLSNPVVFAKHPVAAFLLVFFFAGPFLYQDPPAIFVELFWLGMLITLTWMIWKQWPSRMHRLWMLLLLVYVISGMASLLVQGSLGERWLLLFTTLAAVVPALQMVRWVRQEPQRYPVFLDEVLLFFVALMLIAAACNAAGLVTLSKLLMNAGIIAVVVGVALHVCIILLLEGLYMQFEQTNIRIISSYTDYNTVKQRFSTLLVAGAVVLWVLAFVWSIGYSDFLNEAVRAFLHYDIRLGEISFTPANLLILVAVIWIALFLARLLTYFFGTTESAFVAGKKSKVGSWVLLARLGIIIMGFLIGIAAAGIPMDRLAIVLGALSVGIGFGLQNIVNNLVSGVILAFEKPMQVGDVIEVGTRTGTVQEIGIRSSKIKTFEGSEIIVPNGDFISQQLINWTLSNNNRRVELLLAVAYGTNLQQVKQLISSILGQRADILSNPAFMVLVHDFANGVATIRVLFWTGDFDRWIVVKDEVLQQIYDSFAQNGITMPFPQQDIYIREFPKQ